MKIKLCIFMIVSIFILLIGLGSVAYAIAPPLYPNRPIPERVLRSMQNAKPGGGMISPSNTGVLKAPGDGIGGTLLQDYIKTHSDVNVIIVMVEFNDVQFGLNARQEMITLAARLKNYYQTQSSYRLNINCEVSTKKYSLGFNEGHYGNALYMGDSASLLISDAVKASDGDIDFSKYQCIMVAHAGIGDESLQNPGTDKIWSKYTWSEWLNLGYIVGTNDGVNISGGTVIPEKEDNGKKPFGPICHEFGHQLGLPDLYDNTKKTTGGIGDWSLMASGAWCGLGDAPANLDPYCLNKLGWLAYENITSNMYNFSFADNKVYRVEKDGATGGNDYFLLQKRKMINQDAQIPGEGLLIYRVHEKSGMNPNDSDPRLIVVMEADGSNALTNLLDTGAFTDNGSRDDPFPPYSLETINSFNSFTSPSSKIWNNTFLNTGYNIFSYVSVDNIKKTGSGSSLNITADVGVSSSNNYLTVKIRPQEAIDNGAQWRIYNIGDSWRDSGSKIFLQKSVPFVIEFKPVKGWQKQNTPVTIYADNTTYYDYSPVPLNYYNLNVAITPPAAVTAGAQWKLSTDSQWRNSGDSALLADGTAYIIQYKDITGMTKPANKSGTVTGANISDSGNYSVNNLSINPSNTSFSANTNLFWISSGTVTYNGSLVSNATVTVKVNGNIVGSGTTTSGNYSISCSGFATAGSYPVTVEASYNGIIATNSSQMLSVSDPQFGYDLRLDSFSYSPQSLVSGNVNIQASVFNNSTLSGTLSGNIVFKLISPAGQEQTQSYSFSLAQGVSTGLQSYSFPVSGNGGYTVTAYIANATKDADPLNNSQSGSVYVGPTPDYKYYTVYNGNVALYQTGTYDQHSVYVLYCENSGANLLQQGLASYLIDSDPTQYPMNPGDVNKFYNSSFIIKHLGATTASGGYSNFEAWVMNPYQTAISPTNVQVTQGQNDAYYTISCSDPSNIRMYQLETSYSPDDYQVLSKSPWNFSNSNWTRVSSGGNYKAIIPNIPLNAALKTYTFWLKYSFNSKIYVQKVQFTVNPCHDISVNSLNLSPVKTNYNVGDNIQIGATFRTLEGSGNVSVGYKESVNTILTITGSNGIVYTSNKNFSVNGELTLPLDSWNTIGIDPNGGNYTIKVSAAISGDANLGNNSAQSTISINPMPQLSISTATDKTTYLQGDTIYISSSITDPNNTSVNNAFANATITLPDSTTATVPLTYNSSTGKYTASAYASKTGTYSVSTSASKSAYRSGTAVCSPAVNNAPPETTIINTWPKEGSTINNTSVTFNWSGTDTGTPTGSLQYSWKLDSGAWSSPSSATSVNLTNLTSSLHTFFIKAIDGNMLEDSTPASRNFTVDTFSPGISSVTSKVGVNTSGLYEAGDAVVITLIASNNETGLSGTATITSALLQYSTTLPLTAIGSGTYYCNWSTTNCSASNDYKVGITLSDGAGNLNSSSPDYTISLHSPVLTVNINPSAAVAAGAQWRLSTETIWHNSGAAVEIHAGSSYIVIFKDGITGWSKQSDLNGTMSNVNKTENGTYLQTNNTATTVQTIILTQGWNIFSFNVDPVSNKTTDILAPLNGKYTTIRSFYSDGPKVFDPKTPTNSDLLTMDTSHGYQIKMLTNATLTVTGTPILNNRPIEVVSNSWNIIGYPLNVSGKLPGIISQLNGQYYTIQGIYDGEPRTYNPAVPANSDLTTFDPGHGYKIKLKSAVSSSFTYTPN